MYFRVDSILLSMSLRAPLRIASRSGSTLLLAAVVRGVEKVDVVRTVESVGVVREMEGVGVVRIDVV